MKTLLFTLLCFTSSLVYGAQPTIKSERYTDTDKEAVTHVVYCESGQLVTGGGASVDKKESFALVESYPDPTGTGWMVTTVPKGKPIERTVHIYAICLPMAS
ncbi:hypothetical protein GQ42DRAFT_165439 [Ramicandelaber brevisporus]|nr:hypothetical protein GQ42DRAFT_165439 [Ramicandelaber brevisporus]